MTCGHVTHDDMPRPAGMSRHADMPRHAGMSTTPNRDSFHEVATLELQPALDGVRIFLLPRHELEQVALVLVHAHLAVGRRYLPMSSVLCWQGCDRGLLEYRRTPRKNMCYLVQMSSEGVWSEC